MSRVEGCTEDQLKTLRKLTAYKVDAQSVYFSGSPSALRFLMSKRGEFPTGLLYIVENYLQNVPHVKKDHRTRPEPRHGLFKASLAHTPRPEQIEAAEACKRAHRGIVCATTGTGKSLIAALIVEALQVPTLIVVPTLALKAQLTADLRATFGADRVGGLGEALAVENVDALDPKKPLKGYHCVIVDEFHHSGAKTYRELNVKAWQDVYFRFGLTATPFRSNADERLLLESVLSEVVYRLDYKKAVSKGYVVPVEAYYINLPKINNDLHTWPEVYSNLVVNNKYRNRIISNIIQDLYEEGKKTLCLVKEINHGHNILKDRSLVPFVTGEDIGSRAWLIHFIEGKATTLIGTTGVLGEGVDTKPAEYVIIAGLGKSKTQFMQQVGRGLRLYPGKESCKVIIFRDPSHKYTLRHFREQCRFLLDEYGVKPVKLEV